MLHAKLYEACDIEKADLEIPPKSRDKIQQVETTSHFQTEDDGTWLSHHLPSGGSYAKTVSHDKLQKRYS